MIKSSQRLPNLPPADDDNPHAATAAALATPAVCVTARSVPRPKRRSTTASSLKPLAFQRRRWVWPAMYITDMAALQLSLMLGYMAREALTPWLGKALWQNQYAYLALAMLALPMGFHFAGLYPGYGLGAVERLRKRIYTVGLLFALLIVSPTDRGNGLSRGVLLMTAGFAVILGPLMEAMARRLLMAAKAWGTPVVILGAAETGKLVARILSQEPELGMVPVAAYDDDQNKWDSYVEGIPVLGPLTCARKISSKVRIALIAMPGMSGPQKAHLCARLPFPRVILIPDLIGMASLWVTSRDLGGVVGLEVKKSIFERRNWAIKRTLDYLLGIPLFLLSLPLLGIFAVWVKWVSPGPVLYSQPRVGLGGKTIRVWKLRTMYPDADDRLKECLEKDPEAFESWKRFCKMKNDPRVLPGVGKLLRKTSLDELPQLWNVLKGEMSLVGPRPFPHYHLSRFRPEFRTLRRSVMPGLTGLWQVSARSDGDVNVQEVLDTYYIRNWSPWLDLYLVARTVGAVLLGRGAY